MTYSFRSASSFTERHGLFVAVAGGTNSGKSFSALRLARGIAGPRGRVAAIDTEGGRLLHLKQHHDFDVMMMDPPHRPARYADAAKAAEDAGFDVLVIDSFSMEWVGIGGVLDWQAEEYERMGSREAVKLASWIKPKVGHKAMVYSLLQRRIPIVFSLRAEDKAKKDGNQVKSSWEPICNKAFPFELTVSFMLMQNRQGVIDLSLPHKLEGAHRPMFRDGDQLSEDHGAALAAWARGEGQAGEREKEREKSGPDGWPMVDLALDLHKLKSAAGWVRNCGRAIGALESVQALDGWVAAMLPNFDALAAFDEAAVAEVRRMAGDRRLAMLAARDAEP
jgi:hypothetical protein